MNWSQLVHSERDRLRANDHFVCVYQNWNSIMKRVICAILALGALAFGGVAMPGVASANETAVAETPLGIPVWQPSEDTEIRYNIFRKGKPFGTHVTRFELGEDGAFEVDHEIELKAKIGPVTVYKYSHTATEVWDENRLIALRGETRKNGDEILVTAAAEGDVLAVSGTNFSGEVDADIVPATHWNIRQMFEGGILSTEGGQTLDVVVEELGRETLTIAGERVETTKFSLASDLTVFLWYDDTGRWVKCAFTARGQNIDYELQSLY